MKKPTMRDIAEAVGTSVVTVSNALTGKPGLSGELRREILKKAEEIGYRYPGEERIRTRDPLNVGIVIPEKYFGEESYYFALYRKLVTALSARGHFALLEVQEEDRIRRMELPNLLRSGRVDGLILLGEPGKAYYRMIAQQETPVVFLDFYDEQGNADSVVGDNTYGTYRLTSHLIRNGHTRIGFVGNRRTTSSIMDRYLGYYRAMLVNGLAIRDDWILADRNDEGILCDPELPEELPTAFVCNCDMTAGRLIDRLRERGIRVPEDLSVTGFDDFVRDPDRTPALSTFRVDTDSMAELAVKALAERCGGIRKPCGRIVVGGQPIYRESDGPAPEDRQA